MSDRIVLCRWPVQDIWELQRFCAKPIPAEPGPDYCAAHRARLPFWPVAAP